jgi:hypothetical protein
MARKSPGLTSIQFVMKDDSHEHLKAIASRENTTVSGLIRRALAKEYPDIDFTVPLPGKAKEGV